MISFCAHLTWERFGRDLHVFHICCFLEFWYSGLWLVLCPVILYLFKLQMWTRKINFFLSHLLILSDEYESQLSGIYYTEFLFCLVIINTSIAVNICIFLFEALHSTLNPLEFEFSPCHFIINNSCYLHFLSGHFCIICYPFYYS